MRMPGSSGCWPRLSWKRTPCGSWPKELLSPARRRRAVEHLQPWRHDQLDVRAAQPSGRCSAGDKPRHDGFEQQSEVRPRLDQPMLARTARVVYTGP
jgi:hypothetical protein